MRFGRFEYQGNVRYGEFRPDGTVLPWSPSLAFPEWAADQPAAGPNFENDSGPVLFSSVSIRCPLESTGKIICVGKNYADHALEMGGEVPELPVIFSKFSSALSGPENPVVLPAISSQVDFEAELVVVIGRPGKHIRQQDAMKHVLGYTCGNDISARDWQKGRPGGQWLLGKTFDTFAPIGPSIVTADELVDPGQLHIQMRLNGREMQSANTSLLIYPVDFLIHHLSRFFALETGDLIFTGTPAGVGAGRNPPVFLADGDVCEVEIENIGILQNPVQAENPGDSG